ncbi:MAG: hypothetical protein AAB156_04885 [Pseudomonadota bacterium]
MKNLVVVALLLLWSPSHAFEQTFESCSVDALTFFNNINNYILGVPLEKLKSQPGIPQGEVKYLDHVYNLIKTQGIEKAYMIAHVAFFKCSKTVSQKKLPSSLSQKESAYQECASKSTTRTTILLQITKGVPITETKSKAPKQVHELVNALYQLTQEKNLTSALVMSAEAHNSCVGVVLPRFP